MTTTNTSTSAPAAPSIPPEDITALILAGGRGSRMGGIDKGLQSFNGLPLALHTLARLQMGGHTGPLIVNANDFIQHGGRKIDAWTAQHQTVIVPFDQAGDDPHAFFNANTLAELQHLESLK